jgi:hypothetical protein
MARSDDGDDAAARLNPASAVSDSAEALQSDFREGTKFCRLICRGQVA